ncbi:sodium channel protein Nach [Tribolium castaneum]|uniref:Pickpocket protein 28-like protein n=1 Tax=Tribolium castaneum TaxID=7070 RepID=A0A139WHB4_TRICA|nr:PREDICTED: sodium channel protein Nach [Tribolium castaneum]KYB27274.1 Pickpocket protein 28-like protein [Tribolium castaneum]|eukprot:XP_015835817.1 PREDICTED: sodium channel protein Nach [Tribolium castaneum]
MPQKHFSFWAMLKYEGKQFCLNTALHGYRFIVLPKRILLERVFWTTIVTISLISAVVLLLLAWINFQENPTLLVTDSTHYPIWNYPFPAVTICSFNKILKRRAVALAEELDKAYCITTEELANDLRIVFQLIYNNNKNIPQRNYSRLQDILDYNEYPIEDVMKYLAPKCSELLQRCKWKGEEKRCESLFEPIKTTEGYCCAFNYYALKNHTFGGALANKIPAYPRRVSACGYLTALEVLVNSYPADYFGTQIAAIGHRVLIHNSYVYPDWGIQNLLTEKGIINLIGVTPSKTYSTESIRGIDVSKRKCLFNNESQLHNFVHYNFQNCIIECRMNLSRQYCGCIPFYYQHETGTYPKTRTCNLRDVQCLTDHRKLLMSSVPGYDFSRIGPDHKWGTEQQICRKCLPDCDYVEYAGEASSGVFTREYSSNQLNLYGGIVIKDQSVVRVYFNDLVATKNRRDVIFSWHTLLAFYGGLLGLFTGFSFVSAIELVYFFTIRLLIDVRQKNEIARKKKERFVQVKPHSDEILNPKHLPTNYNRFNLRRRSNSNS